MALILLAKIVAIMVSEQVPGVRRLAIMTVLKNLVIQNAVVEAKVTAVIIMVIMFVGNRAGNVIGRLQKIVPHMGIGKIAVRRMIAAMQKGRANAPVKTKYG